LVGDFEDQEEGRKIISPKPEEVKKHRFLLYILKKV
jgi:hypothetical protein